MHFHSHPNLRPDEIVAPSSNRPIASGERRRRSPAVNFYFGAMVGAVVMLVAIVMLAETYGVADVGLLRCCCTARWGEIGSPMEKK
jgi:hypothetical protein